ncbi:MAG: DEAD/DEAH box helicase, partial [Phycisphaerae bacterium]|nr:DEAD/DEAH box helicase [Phycisphaerae bacterium]
SGKVDFGGQSVSLPALLAAMRRGETTVALGDGTFGLLPEEWLAKYVPLASVAKTDEDVLRFTKTQIGLLDALLATQPDSTFDETYRKTRDELMRFEGITAGEAPAGFVGELRHYQQETLGWFDFLRRFGFGGCLADDMGLGKTVQVLALLESRRTSSELHGPSLVVVPRSLVFNWCSEAARFAPQLRLLDHSGINRAKEIETFADYDVIITTYGTLRRDAMQLKDVRFDYIVLDEAQAIKNPNSESAKAARLLRGDNRLVLSGTPVQNHLGDLWSLFEFLNPGMLGAVSAFSAATFAGGGADADGRALLARGLRPFILRRTKEQVAPELPARMEQTLYCELEADQRKLYDELREHYRHSLMGLIDREGLGKAKIQILEALLRLRQAACHPGLIDKTRDADNSAKLDTLIPRLLEVTEDGHKALIFSQFTQFLSIVRKKLDKEGLVYEYLDGRTRDRQQRVDRFQTDDNCKLFLISLKAGGLGLNLTAADYVFLLDPWWNPAVEAQAIDRSHRIGQTRQVFACRLIARDTVEEKVLSLQQSKQSLADAIINGDNSVLRSIGREDLQLLLS